MLKLSKILLNILFIVLVIILALVWLRENDLFVINHVKVVGNNLTALDQDWYNIKPSLPVASGGLSPLHIPDLMEILGKNLVYQFGGGCHGHPDGTEAGARAIRQSISSVLEGYELEDYAKDHSELARALEKWG